MRNLNGSRKIKNGGAGAIHTWVVYFQRRHCLSVSVCL